MMYLHKRSRIYLKSVKYFKSKYKEIQFFINNQKIKTKTIYLYVFCVLVPVLITNLIIIGSSIEATRKERMKNMNNIADSVIYDINSSFEDAVYVTMDLYVSSSIYNFLDTQYKNRGEFFQVYNRVFDYYVFYASSKNIISSITLYSDNATMINGGRYFRIDTIQSKEWYLKFLESKEDLLILPYYNSTEYTPNKKRMISVIRRLNYNEMSKIEKCVKLDLNYEMILENVKKSAFNTIVYICNGNDIIFSNDEKTKGLKDKYCNITDFISKEDAQLYTSMSAFGLEFDLYLKGYELNYIRMLSDRFWILLALLLADALIPAIMLSLFSHSITKRILYFGNQLNRVKNEEFEPIAMNEGKDEIGELVDNYNLMVARMKKLIEYEYKSKLEQQELHLAKQQAELLALHSQINPHFLFNVLESIRMRSVIKEEHETSTMIESLARLMRKSAEWGSDMITLEQEITFTKDYLSLQKYRFGDGFNYNFRIQEECNSVKIPSLALITFVENSCVHGLNREGHTGSIFISAYRENSYLILEIEDTGVGMGEGQVKEMETLLNEAEIENLLKSSSLGMLNTCIRLKKYCGEDTLIIIESERNVGTCVIIKIREK